MVVVTRRGVVGPCKCGVGRCRICNSSCKRCKCDCDGISPRDALERGRGRQKGYSKAKRLRQEELLVAPTLRRSKRTKVVMGDDDSTWLPAVVKRKVAPKKTFKTIQNTNICVEVPIEKKQGKLLNTLLRNKEKKQAVTTNKSTTGATSTEADDDDSNGEDKVVEAVPVGEQSTDGNTSNYIPVEEIYVHSDEDLSALDSKVLGLPRQYRPIRLANDPVIKKNYKDYSSSDSDATLSVAKASIESSNKKKSALEPVDNLIKFLDLPKHYLYNLPSDKSRKTSDNIQDSHPKRFKRMVTFTMKAFQSVLDIICPGPSQRDVVASCVQSMLKNYNSFKDMSKSYTKMGESLSLCLKQANTLLLSNVL